jgi:hypothetical protein
MDRWTRYIAFTSLALAAGYFIFPLMPPIQPAEPVRNKARTELTNLALRHIVIAESRASYLGSCACPYDRKIDGRSCGATSAYSRPGGVSPYCFPDDVPASIIEVHRARLGSI